MAFGTKRQDPPAETRGGGTQEPPPPALRRCILGAAPPVTSEPWAFSRTGPSADRPPLPPPLFLRSSASRIFALRSSLAPDSSFDAGIVPPRDSGSDSR